ncbi:MAG: hypothetical protein AAFX06_14880 [Planctomycetota bacterium]
MKNNSERWGAIGFCLVVGIVAGLAALGSLLSLAATFGVSPVSELDDISNKLTALFSLIMLALSVRVAWWANMGIEAARNWKPKRKANAGAGST